MFTDPKGTEVEIFSDYTFAQDDGRSAGIMPLKLGHVAYRVDDVQKTVKFYSDVLGFRVSDWRDDTFAFLRCSTDHHTVNFVHDAEPQLHHIAFEVKDWAEIQRACESLARHDIHLVWGPGRHIIGHNVAIYHRNRRQRARRVLLRDGPDEGRERSAISIRGRGIRTGRSGRRCGDRRRCATIGALVRSASFAAIRRSSRARQPAEEKIQ